ncbi:hypothetical protein [Paenibacillus sp. ATY16]|uniref:hypothetical protein n=1 Tax=Paenibacillus sp. ATY16 TaxID=1759312 RepID=UPI00200C461B|nr:hypothetical protein [Paenibacillus sp. ATY16]MCK9862041.1 hypothetical protein [Paenibacillus sp. ATY16]
MTMANYKIRIIASACLTRYNAGECNIETIIDSYDLQVEDRELIIDQIKIKRPELNFSSAV